MPNQSRIKVSSGDAIYHCMSRVVAEFPYWDSATKEVMRKQLWRAAEFSGITILTYCLMSNHFHVLVQVPDASKVNLSDEEIMRRYRLLYHRPSPHQIAQLDRWEKDLQTQSSRAASLRKHLLSRMHDVSAFMKTFKQRFSVWYNRSHNRRGTLWSERFKSVLVQNAPVAARTIAAYIDLNPVRAGLVKDPKDYRWCGYAEAVAGNRKAQAGIAAVTGITRTSENTSIKSRTFQERGSRSQALARYRLMLFGLGAKPAHGKDTTATIDVDAAKKMQREEGKIPLPALLRSRLRYFSDGLILGTETFVKDMLRDLQRRGQLGRKRPPHPVSLGKSIPLLAGKRCH